MNWWKAKDTRTASKTHLRKSTQTPEFGRILRRKGLPGRHSTTSINGFKKVRIEQAELKRCTRYREKRKPPGKDIKNTLTYAEF